MSLASTTVFEVRPGAGSPTAGGGFVPGSGGTDWSQQNAPQYSVTDGILTGTTTVTSATANFGTDVVGNIAYIAGAWYQIISRTNATTIVVDRATGSGTGQAINIGGALDLCATAEPLLTAGMTLWIKVGTQTLTTPILLSASGDATNGTITWAGYDQTRGDHTGNQPLITSATNNVKLVDLNTKSARTFTNLKFTSTAGTRGNGVEPLTGGACNQIVISNCTFDGLGIAIYADNGTPNSISGLLVVNCEIKNCASHGMAVIGVTSVVGCYIHGNAGNGINVPSGNGAIPGLIVKWCVIYANAVGIAVKGTSGPSNFSFSNNDVVSNASDGIAFTPSSGSTANVVTEIENNIIYGNGGFGLNITAISGLLFTFLNRCNAYGSNTSGARNNSAAGAGDVTLASDPFTARTANDFSLNSTVGGGAACKAAGFPGSLPGLVAAGSADIGALQSQPASATYVVQQVQNIFVESDEYHA